MTTESAFSFEKDLSRKSLSELVGNSRIGDLVIGDSAYVSIFSLCWQDSGLNIAINEPIVTEKPIFFTGFEYNLIVERMPGNVFSAKTLELDDPDAIATKGPRPFAIGLIQAISYRGLCEDWARVDSDFQSVPIETINGLSSLHDFSVAILKRYEDVKK